MYSSLVSNIPVLALLAAAAVVGSEPVKADNAISVASISCFKCFKGLPVSLQDIPNSNPKEAKLLRDLYFRDSSGLVWKADTGDITDGASIPSEFLWLIGNRFEPDFLPAAIIHDHYTDKRHWVRSWTSAARAFYQAMVTNHTPLWKAELMYYAVYAFGPHWGKLDQVPGKNCGPNCVNYVPNSYTIDSSGTDHITGTIQSMPSGKKFYYEPGGATAADRPEMESVKAKIRAAIDDGAPLSLYQLDKLATEKHPENAFIAAAATFE